MGIQEKRLAVIAKVYQTWALELAGSVRPEPQYSRNGDSQYPEGVEALSAPPDNQADLHQRTVAALKEAGLPVGG